MRVSTGPELVWVGVMATISFIYGTNDADLLISIIKQNFISCSKLFCTLSGYAPRLQL